MKRTVIIYILLMLSFVSACAKPMSGVDNTAAAGKDAGSSTTETAQTEKNTVAPTENHLGEHSVSAHLVISGIEAYHEFVKAAELDDKAFQEYLDSHSTYSMNGINAREDAIKAINALNSVPMPEIAGFDLELADLNYAYDNVSFWLKSNGVDGSLLTFDVKLPISDEDAQEIKDGYDRELVEIPVKDDYPELKYLLRVVLDDKPDSYSYFNTNIHSHRVCFITNMKDDDFLNMLQSCRYTTISDYVQSHM